MVVHFNADDSKLGRKNPNNYDCIKVSLSVLAQESALQNS